MRAGRAGLCGLGHQPDTPEDHGVKRYDPEMYEGRGAVELTSDLAGTLRFDSRLEALSLRCRSRPACPVRPDAKPNRPLTAFNLLIRGGSLRRAWSLSFRFPPSTVSHSGLRPVPTADFLSGPTLPAGGSVTVAIASGSAAVYGATVDNRTGDPSLQIARAAP